MLDIKNPSKFHVELHNQYATRKIWNKNVMKIPITLQLSNTSYKKSLKIPKG
jgi:uncharacterized protein YcnI